MPKLISAFFLILPLLGWATEPLGKGLDARSKAKLEFLMEPVFSANQPKLIPSRKNERPDVKTAAKSSADPKFARALEAERKKSDTLERKVLPGATDKTETLGTSPRLVAPDRPGEKGKPEKGVCGTNDYLGSFCFYQLETTEWMLCTAKWGECTKRDEIEAVAIQQETKAGKATK